MLEAKICGRNICFYQEHRKSSIIFLCCNGFIQTHICLIRHAYSPQIRCRKTTNSFVRSCERTNSVKSLKHQGDLRAVHGLQTIARAETRTRHGVWELKLGRCVWQCGWGRDNYRTVCSLSHSSYCTGWPGKKQAVRSYGNYCSQNLHQIRYVAL